MKVTRMRVVAWTAVPVAALGAGARPWPTPPSPPRRPAPAAHAPARTKSPTPVPSPTRVPTATPSPVPSSTRVPTATPSPVPTRVRTATPSPYPSPTRVPTVTALPGAVCDAEAHRDAQPGAESRLAPGPQDHGAPSANGGCRTSHISLSTRDASDAPWLLAGAGGGPGERPMGPAALRRTATRIGPARSRQLMISTGFPQDSAANGPDHADHPSGPPESPIRPGPIPGSGRPGSPGRPGRSAGPV